MTSPSTLRRGLFRHLVGPAIAAGIVCLGIAGPAAADRIFSPIASEILSVIRDSDASRIPASSGYGAPTIAIRSFANNEPPIPAEIANAWNRHLLAELHRQARGQFEFVDISAISALIKTIKGSAGPADNKADRIADLKANIRADILVSGSITLARETPVLTYQALGIENGRLLATSSPRHMNWPERAPAEPVRIVSNEIPAENPGRTPTITLNAPASENATAENAMTKIALALAMGFFSLMVLTLISMGAGQSTQSTPDVMPLAPAAKPASTASADAPPGTDFIIILDGKRFLDTKLRPVDPQTVIQSMTGPARRIVLALDPSLPLKEAMAARARYALSGDRVSVVDIRADGKHLPGGIVLPRSRRCG